MANRHVREIGTVPTFDGAIVRVGVDYETVSITLPAGHVRLSIDQAAVFMRLWLEAVGVAEKVRADKGDLAARQS